ncbi:MAG TPA: hypothetical protein VGC24_05145, partial [Burkholderiaceae bacterium]
PRQTGTTQRSTPYRAQFTPGGAGTLVVQTIPNSCFTEIGRDFCNWTAVGASFSGTARSVDFGGMAAGTAYDNITVGNVQPVIPKPSVPVPTLPLPGLAVLVAGLAFSARYLLRRQPRG